MSAEYPFASWYRDRHGRIRWRFRHAGRTVSLPGAPGDPEFAEAYRAALEGRSPRTAKVESLPTAARPRTFSAAWRMVVASAEWQALAAISRTRNEALARELLTSRIVETDPTTWADVPVADLRRRHLKQLIADHAATPHKAKHLLVVVRKMIHAALDEEWIDVDPSYGIKWRPAYGGHRAWTVRALEKFEARWPVGSAPRLVYALALWLGNRRADVATLRWDQKTTRAVTIAGESRRVEGFLLRQGKGGKELFVPIAPMLAEILAATPRRGETVLVTAWGRPFSAKSLTGRVADWTREAGLEPGFTLHGLRKTLGQLGAEGGATTRQLMDILGHDAIVHAELYSRAAEQTLLATEGMDKVTALWEARRKGA